MSVHLTLNRERPSYSTFDTVAGTVTVKLPVPTTVSAISVKLEGEASTTLRPITGDNNRDKKNTQSEVHKVLYYIQTVFPAPEVLRCSASGATWTVSPGRYEFPFSFKIPYESECLKNAQGHPSNIGDLLLDTNRYMYNVVHIRRQLPPSLDSLHNQAGIRYFVKATVVRPAFYQSNYRALTRITFIPSEPQRPESSKDETFARRQYAFGTNRSQSLLGRVMRKGEPVVDLAGDQPSFCVDARLPCPAILTCNRPIPLRIVVKKLNDSTSPIHLNSLDIEIIGYTDMRSRNLRQSDTAMWSVLSLPHLNTCIASGTVTAGTEWDLDQHWAETPLPEAIAPTFTTCNISRNYELQVRLGFSNGPIGSRNVQTTLLPLKLNCEIFSGIVPPPHVLAANMPPQPLVQQPVVPPSGPPPKPPRPAVPPSVPEEAADDAPPPSYEDAVAESVAEAAAGRPVPSPPARAPSRRKPVPPPVTTNFTSSSAGPSSAPPLSVQSTSQSVHQPPPGPPPRQSPGASPGPAPSPPSGPPPHAATNVTPAPPPGPPPNRTERSVTMPTGSSTSQQPNLLDDSPDFGPQRITPQATGNNPFAEYLTEPHPQQAPISQFTSQLTHRHSAQSSLLDTSPAYTPTVTSVHGNSPRNNNSGNTTTNTNNPFAQYLDQGQNQSSQNNYPVARDVSAQIDEDQALAERLQQLEMEGQEEGTIPSQTRPTLPPRPATVSPNLMEDSPSGTLPPPMSPTATGNNPFGSYLAQPAPPQRLNSTQPYHTTSQPQYPNYTGNPGT